jgi:aryl carrier-like protein
VSVRFPIHQLRFGECGWAAQVSERRPRDVTVTACARSLDHRRVLSALERTGSALPPILRQLVGTQAPVAADFSELLPGLPETEAEARLVALIRVHAAQVLGVSENAINDAQPMLDLGLDSVMAVELRNRLGVAIGSRLAPRLLFRFPSPRVLAERIREAVLDGVS